jgi:uncharacterized Zn finger protein
MGWYHEFKPYVPVATRRARAAAYAAKLAKKEKRQLAPITIAGRAIATTYWGQAWCQNLERYSDFENRLPRGRTYARNGSVIDLQIKSGTVRALVSGSSVYRVTIGIRKLGRALWKNIKADCGQSIASLIDLLQARFDKSIMERLARPEQGLFPQPSEIDMDCSCPDWAGMCKHVAAVLYGVGARLDSSPELLFQLRSVDHLELVHQAASAKNLERSLASAGGESLSTGDLEAMFGIELDQGPGAAKMSGERRSRSRRETHSPAADAVASVVAAPAMSRTKTGRKKSTVAPRRRGLEKDSHAGRRAEKPARNGFKTKRSEAGASK